jgi:hypothetical protein
VSVNAIVGTLLAAVGNAHRIPTTLPTKPLDATARRWTAKMQKARRTGLFVEFQYRIARYEI